MAKVQLLDRRMLLTNWGRGAVAVAILGPSVVACSSNGDDAAVLVPTTAPTSEPPAEPTEDEPAEPNAEPTEAEPAAAEAPTLRWERVDFEFVSAYVLARGDQVAIVDTGTAGNAERIEAALAALDAGWGDVDHVVLTHLHPDHVGGLPAVLDAAATAQAYAGEADVAGITSPRPLVPVNDGDEVFGLEVIATPGHTPGHIAVIDEAAGLLVAGDALNESGGQVLGANPQFSSDMTAADNSVRVLAARRFDTLVVGHGEPIVGDASDQVATLAASL